MTTANKITIFRILLVPFLVVHLIYYVQNGVEYHRVLAAVSFLVAAVSDGLDGYVARRYHQRSDLGAILDPLADKLLLVSSMILLTLDNRPYLDRLPLWLTVTVFSRDLLLMIGMGVIYYTCGKITVRPHFVGKIATVLQMVAIGWTLFRWNSQWLHGFVIAATAFTGVSALIYVRDGVRQLSASPSSLPRVDQ